MSRHHANRQCLPDWKKIQPYVACSLLPADLVILTLNNKRAKPVKEAADAANIGLPLRQTSSRESIFVRYLRMLFLNILRLTYSISSCIFCRYIHYQGSNNRNLHLHLPQKRKQGPTSWVFTFASIQPGENARGRGEAPKTRARGNKATRQEKTDIQLQEPLARVQYDIRCSLAPRPPGK